MRLADLLLGRDTEDLRVVRKIRVLLWWGAWAALVGSVLALLYSFTQPPFIGQTPWFVFALQIIPAVAAAFGWWALVTLLLGIHGLLAVDTDDAEYEDDLNEEDPIENPDEETSRP